MAGKGIMAILAGDPKEDSGEGEDSSVKAAHRLKVDAMNDFLQAVESKNAEGMATAFQGAYEACSKAKSVAAPAEEAEEATEEY